MPDLSTQLREYFDATTPPVEVEEVMTDDLWVPSRRRTQSRRSISPGWAYGIAATFVVMALIVGLALLLPGGSDNEVAGSTTPSGPESPFLGRWVTTDADGSTPTATLQVSGDDVVEMVVVDDYASVCSGAPSTMTGTGRLESGTMVVIAQPILTCDDGSQPEPLSGPPLEEQLQNLTFTYDPETDTLIDNFGMVWTREGSEGPDPDATAMGWWPQSSAEEVADAQELADAGDPDVTWQLDTALAADGEPWGAEIFARFIEEELGWEDFIGGWDGGGYLSMGAGGGVYEDVVFIRCAPGATNPLSPLFADASPEIRGCAPTINELTYETVSVDVSQPGRRGPEGIWVVTRWETLQPTSVEPGSGWEIIHPDPYDHGQVEQVVPPSDAEVTEFLEAFLRARVDGEGAEQYVLRDHDLRGYVLRDPEQPPFDSEVPLLYATTDGAAYQRFEIEHVHGPVWPTGWSEFKLRLFGEDGTVVEQYFHVVRHDGQLGLLYGIASPDHPTTENGQSVPVPYSLLDGEVTFAAAPPWSRSIADPSDAYIRLQAGREEFVAIGTDPQAESDCENPLAPTDAETLARSITANPDFETTGTVPVRIAALDGLQMDVDVNYNSCWFFAGFGPDQLTQWRTRLYLLDYPGESAGILMITVIAPEIDFERVIEKATPIVESLEIHAP